MRFFVIRTAYRQARGKQPERWLAEVTRGLHGIIDKEGKKIEVKATLPVLLGGTEDKALEVCLEQLKTLGLMVSPYTIVKKKEKQ